ncbi:MAG: hypothetical protein LBT00_05755, partial [Spirochaetaceae bacterium]|nr:hypothetical protein [Spirochaetaceae bacterium]
ALLLKTVKEGRPVDGVPFLSAPVSLSGVGTAVLERCFRREPPSRKGKMPPAACRGPAMTGVGAPRQRMFARFVIFV